ncbi:MAG: LptF/LptG family permease [Candidatus Euphemobacter frigidus]|nr:LptF/LptG family permease [Candidatus Euphemobacter frigidus]MDP8276594.1 LptF/LptG family permease [Candidatus Euphemobacter frigidus]
MRILDRYIYTKFLVPFIYCMVSFIMLFVIGDLFENLEDFLQVPNWFTVIIRYYLLFIPSTISYITAVAILLALLSSLGHLQKHNEISAMRSAGISIYRIAFPLLLLSLVISLAVLYINEKVVPQTMRDSQLLKKQQTGISFDEVLSDVTYYNPMTNRSYYFESFYPDKNTGEGITVYELRTDGQPYRRITAEKGAWLDGKWWFFNGIIYTYPRKDIPIKKNLTKEAFDFEVRPVDLLESKNELSYLGYFELKESLARKAGWHISTLRPALVELHQKLSLPMACLIMGLLGISFGLKSVQGGMLAGVGISLALGFLYYALFSLTGALGNQGFLQPWLAAWAANIVFGLLGLFFLIRLN